MTAADHANTALCGDCFNPIGCAKYGCRKPAAADHANTARERGRRMAHDLAAAADKGGTVWSQLACEQMSRTMLALVAQAEQVEPPVEFVCAHQHRWLMPAVHADDDHPEDGLADEPRRCPVCGTITFRGSAP